MKRTLSFLALVVGFGCGSSSSENPAGAVEDSGSDDVLSTDDGVGDDAGDDTKPGADATPDVPAGPLKKWTALSVGYGQVCALDDSGKAYCWGSRIGGGCGDGDKASKEYYWMTPHAVVGGHTFTKIAAGGDHVCAITAEKKLYCWGSNVKGQIGDGGPTSTTPTDDKANHRFEPVAIMPASDFVDVAAGNFHTCAATTDGKTYCWGDNEFQQSGQNIALYEVDTPMTVTTSASLVSLSLGANHSCGLAATGSAYCWGSHSNGGLGDGASYGAIDTKTPAAVAGARVYSQIAATFGHTCAIEKDTAAVWCWGQNSYAELGVMPPDMFDRSNVPVRAAAPFTAKSITTFDNNTCAIGMDGAAYCWGYETGTGVFADGKEFSADMHTVIATPFKAVGGHTFTTISGKSEMVCAIEVDGSIWCWGASHDYRLSNAKSVGRNATPIRTAEPGPT